MRAPGASTTMELGLVGAVALVASCAGNDGEATEPQAFSVDCEVRGTVTDVSIPPGGNATFRVKPRAVSGIEGLPPGQMELSCQVLPTERPSLDWVLQKLQVGDTVTVVGKAGPAGDGSVGIRRVAIIAIF